MGKGEQLAGAWSNFAKALLGGGGGGPRMTRREFLQKAGAGAALAATKHVPVPNQVGDGVRYMDDPALIKRLLDGDGMYDPYLRVPLAHGESQLMYPRWFSLPKLDSLADLNKFMHDAGLTVMDGGLRRLLDSNPDLPRSQGHGEQKVRYAWDKQTSQWYPVVERWEMESPDSESFKETLDLHRRFSPDDPPPVPQMRPVAKVLHPNSKLPSDLRPLDFQIEEPNEDWDIEDYYNSRELEFGSSSRDLMEGLRSDWREQQLVRSSKGELQPNPDDLKSDPELKRKVVDSARTTEHHGRRGNSYCGGRECYYDTQADPRYVAPWASAMPDHDPSKIKGPPVHTKTIDNPAFVPPEPPYPLELEADKARGAELGKQWMGRIRK